LAGEHAEHGERDGKADRARENGQKGLGDLGEKRPDQIQHVVHHACVLTPGLRAVP
jgi:hypothetical protein